MPGRRADDPGIRKPAPERAGSTPALLADLARPLLAKGIAFGKAVPGHTRAFVERLDVARRVDQSRRWVKAQNFPAKATRFAGHVAKGGRRAVTVSRRGIKVAQAKAGPVMAGGHSRALGAAEALGRSFSAALVTAGNTLEAARARIAERRTKSVMDRRAAKDHPAMKEMKEKPPAPVPSELMRLLKEEGIAVDGLDVREALPDPVRAPASAQGALPLFADDPISPPPPQAKDQSMPRSSPAKPPEVEPPAETVPQPSRAAAIKTLGSALFTGTGSTPFYKNRTFHMTIGATAFLAAAGAAALMMMQGTATSSGAGTREALGQMDRSQVEAIVRDYILANPEIIPEAMERLQSRRMAAVVEQYRKELETPFAGGWEGARDADVVLVEFFDYACGYCKASLADIDRLLAEDKNLKVVYRELPILSEASSEAAKASLYAAKQGEYGSFHRALYAAGRPTQESIDAAAKKAGFEPEALRTAMQATDINAEIQNNLRLAQALQATGTPTWVVGGQVLSGAVGYDVLKEAIARARQTKP